MRRWPARGLRHRTRRPDRPGAPGILGTDPALDGYAQGCFAGALDVCDRLYDESAPFSECERYASTWGGRVKPLAVALCTQLE